MNRNAAQSVANLPDTVVPGDPADRANQEVAQQSELDAREPDLRLAAQIEHALRRINARAGAALTSVTPLPMSFWRRGSESAWRRSPAGFASGDAAPLPLAAALSPRHRARAQPMCRPPLSEKSAPVAKPASSEAIQATIEAISSGVPRRLVGMLAMILSSTSCRIAFTMSVPM